MKQIIALSYLCFFGSFGLVAQDFDYLMIDGGTITIDCADGVVSMASDTVNYGPGESWSITFCPDGGNAVSFIINSDNGSDFFDILAGDLLTVFDGDDTSAPILGMYNNTFTDSPAFVSLFATLENPGGCLTFLFESTEGSSGAAGFSSLLGCGNFWQPFDFSFTSTDSEIDDFGYIDICQGEEVTITADGIFPYSDGTGYEQTNENCYYEWDLGDGTLLEGFGLNSVTNVYTEQFGYPVELFVTDPEGLINRFELSVRVSTTPNFAGVISQFQDTICLGSTTTLVGSITDQDSTSFGVFPVQSSFIGGGFLAGQTFLPDGLDSYQTTIVLDQFPVGTTVENPEDIIAICATLEHSYLGDLDIELSCPDGTTIVLQEQGGGSCNLGEPWATDPVDQNSPNITPGVGYEYCWTADATLGLDEGCGGTIDFISGDGPGTYQDSQVPAGDYAPDEPLSGLVGCPINGEWTITVTDNLPQDNGYIFSWGIQFDPSIDPTVENYTPALVDGFWLDDPSIVLDNDTSILVQPASLGEHCYTFNVSDNFGCDYDTTVCLTVIPAVSIAGISPGCFFTSEVSVNNSYQGGIWTAVGPTEDSPAPFLPIGSGEVMVFEPGDYTLTYQDSFCQFEQSVDIYFPPPPIADIIPDTLTICYGFSGDLSSAPQPDGIPVSYAWNYDSLGFQMLQGFASTVEIFQPGTYTLEVTDQVCDTTLTDIIIVDAEICEISTFNVFTPNGDGANDFFYVEAIDKFSDPVVYIYNRWGNLLYEKKNYQNNWDMDGLVDGTYYYVILNPQNNESFKGHFTLVR